jgi:chromosome segregation ATPase
MIESGVKIKSEYWDASDQFQEFAEGLQKRLKELTLRANEAEAKLKLRDEQINEQVVAHGKEIDQLKAERGAAQGQTVEAREDTVKANAKILEVQKEKIVGDQQLLQANTNIKKLKELNEAAETRAKEFAKQLEAM